MRFAKTLLLFNLFFTGVLSASEHQILVRFKSASGNFKPQSVFAKNIKPLLSSNPSRLRAFSANSQYVGAMAALERTMIITVDGDMEAALANLRLDPSVELAEPNYPMRVSQTPNDPLYTEQWGLENSGQAGSKDGFDPIVGVAGRDIDAELAWDIQTGSSSIVVAVIDAGIAWAHPDLAANIWSNPGETAGNSVDDEVNGKIDDVRGWDFGSNDANPDDTCTNANALLDAGGHGTHVSGIVAAVGNNGVGVTGTSWASQIMPLKVADESCAINTSEVAQAIVYAVTNGADIINMSLGGSASSTLQAAVNVADAAEVVVVAAAGNEATEDETNSFPAAYSNVIAVAATARNDQFASFSNFGDWITLSAPGVAIRSTFPILDGSYGYLSGTSMASPMTAGVAALVLSEDPALTVDQVRTRLINSCESIESINPSRAGKMGAGRLNALRALLVVTEVNPSTAPNTAVTPVIILTGENFSGGMTAKLAKSGESDIPAIGLVVHSASSATATFNITGAAGGRWDVVVTRGAGSSTFSEAFGVLSSSFEVVALDPAQSTTDSVTVGARTHTVVWPTGVLSQAITLDIDATLNIESFPTVGVPYVRTGVALELNPSVEDLAFNKPFTLTMGYILGDLQNQTNEAGLTIARYNEDNLRWDPLPSTVDTVAKTVTASVAHLSAFAILQHTATTTFNLSQAIAFPNPFRTDLGHSRIVFDFLTAGSRVRIFDIAGTLIQDLPDDNNDGQIIWAVTNESGEKIASGMYLYLITDPAGQKETGRIGVIR